MCLRENDKKHIILHRLCDITCSSVLCVDFLVKLKLLQTVHIVFSMCAKVPTVWLAGITDSDIKLTCYCIWCSSTFCTAECCLWKVFCLHFSSSRPLAMFFFLLFFLTFFFHPLY